MNKNKVYARSVLWRVYVGGIGSEFVRVGVFACWYSSGWLVGFVSLVLVLLVVDLSLLVFDVYLAERVVLGSSGAHALLPRCLPWLLYMFLVLVVIPKLFSKVLIRWVLRAWIPWNTVIVIELYGWDDRCTLFEWIDGFFHFRWGKTYVVGVLVKAFSLPFRDNPTR